MASIEQRQEPSALYELDNRRKRIIFRCSHRGMKEMDILLGGYVEDHISRLSEERLSELETLLQINDQDLFAWFVGSKPVPAERDTQLFKDILNYQNNKFSA
ncbi:FAD assembly factor SdhE [Flexibacterium corallicola]|uniref:FAD assembly factor SdhE n=1 Tax=Flexibacterium corallicola TaxID=3037259 RepID=UPI00286F7906|nr:succinate dehydrogenase assembly factor 2 [Pseudovibrio sp. M1P-2-3]